MDGEGHEVRSNSFVGDPQNRLEVVCEDPEPVEEVTISDRTRLRRVVGRPPPGEGVTADTGGEAPNGSVRDANLGT